METPTEAEANRGAAESRRKRLQLLPDPMELAKLATVLKPDLASGTPEEQKMALASARSLFDLAVDVAATPSSADLARNAPEVVRFPVTPTSENAFFTDAKGLAALSDYLRANNIPTPKYLDAGKWGDFIKDHQMYWGMLKKRYVLRVDVDKEIRQFKDLEARRRRVSRGGTER